MAEALTHPYPVGLRVRNYGEQYREARTGTATIIDNTIKTRNGHQEYVVRRDKPLYSGSTLFESQWSDYGTVPAEFPADQDHTPDYDAGTVTCSCGFTGPDDPIATAHARAYGLCGECWGSGTDAYPCLGICALCGGAGTFEAEAVGLAVQVKAESEIEAAMALDDAQEGS